jgi:glycosyltransferase involved in cell wall biosynthesis
MKEASRLRVLYMVYWGAAEPLGRSLVLPAVKRLAELGVDLTLVTFEKPSDLARKEEMGRIARSLDRHGVEWIPLRYHKRPKVPATLFDFLQGCTRGITRRLKKQPEIIHARTFVGGLMGYGLAPLLRARLVYHNEGFYPDEQVDGGVWRAGSVPHRVARFLERRMYERSDGVIALSNRAKQAIESLPVVERKDTPVIVVPSCVDLSRFKGGEEKTPLSSGELRLVYIGSVGRRYELDRIGRFVAVASRTFRHIHLRVLTGTEPGLVKTMLGACGLGKDQWSMDTIAYEAMPGELAGQDAGLNFLTQGLSEHGCSPTKVGEYWAMGLPVITTPNVSDAEDIIENERVGVIVKGHSDDAYKRAAAELESLLKDDNLAARCRRAAERHYALEPACERQLNLYQEITSRAARADAHAESVTTGLR